MATSLQYGLVLVLQNIRTISKTARTLTRVHSLEYQIQEQVQIFSLSLCYQIGFYNDVVRIRM